MILTIADRSYIAHPPALTRDVVEWLGWVPMCGDDHAVVTATVGWVGRHLEPARGIDLLNELSFEQIHAAGAALVAAVSLPPEVSAQLRRMYDEENDVDPAWEMPSSCPCVTCRTGIENPPGVRCRYDVDPRTMRAAQVLGMIGEDSLDAPWWVSELRMIARTARRRAEAWAVQQAEERKRWHDMVHSVAGGMH